MKQLSPGSSLLLLLFPLWEQANLRERSFSCSIALVFMELQLPVIISPDPSDSYCAISMCQILCLVRNLCETPPEASVKSETCFFLFHSNVLNPQVLHVLSCKKRNRSSFSSHVRDWNQWKWHQLTDLQMNMKINHLLVPASQIRFTASLCGS